MRKKTKAGPGVSRSARPAGRRAPRTVRAAAPGRAARALRHELEVHQAELEQQNQELRRSQVALEVARDELRALAARLQAVREEEAARLARDLHDDLGQSLTALQLDLKGIERSLERLPPATVHGAVLDRVVAASELAAGTLVTLRRIAQDLHPSVLDHLGLAAALRTELGRFEQRTGLAVRATLEADVRPGAPAGKALFRICQEALTNVARHARAKRVDVRLWASPDGLHLEVLDDGIGLPAVGAAVTLGLLAMRERALALGGRVTLARRRRGGTSVRAALPWAQG